MRLQRLSVLRSVFVRGLLLQRVRACPRQLLVLRLPVLLLPFLPLLRGAGRLAPRLHVERMLVGGSGRRRVRICGSVR